MSTNPAARGTGADPAFAAKRDEITALIGLVSQKTAEIVKFLDQVQSVALTWLVRARAQTFTVENCGSWLEASVIRLAQLLEDANQPGASIDAEMIYQIRLEASILSTRSDLIETHSMAVWLLALYQALRALDLSVKIRTRLNTQRFDEAARDVASISVDFADAPPFARPLAP